MILGFVEERIYVYSLLAAASLLLSLFSAFFLCAKKP
jgi:hypothetical protein